MEDRTGNGFIKTPSGERHPVRYFVRMHKPNPQYFYDSYGRLVSANEDLFGDLIVAFHGPEFQLILEDGSELPIRLLSTSGSFHVLYVPELAAHVG